MSLGIVLALLGFVAFSHMKMAQQNPDSNSPLRDAHKAVGLPPDTTAPLLSPTKV